MGILRFHKTRDMPSPPKMWTIAEKNDRWSVNFVVEKEGVEGDPDRPAIGFDMASSIP